MSKISFAAVNAACAVALTSQGVSAQSLRSVESAGRGETRGMASLTIPLGGAQRSLEAKPRLDFALEASRIGQDRFNVNSWDERISIRRTTLSLTLDQRPTVMLNGQSLATIGLKLGADEDGKESGGGGATALYVVGGVLVVGLGLAAFTASEIRDDFSDLIGPED